MSSSTKNENRVTIRLSPQERQQLQRFAKTNNITISKAVRTIINDHFYLDRARTLKELTSQAMSVVPDLKEQKSALQTLSDTIHEFIDITDETNDTIRSMKSGENYYFRQIYEMLTQSSSHTSPSSSSSKLNLTETKTY